MPLSGSAFWACILPSEKTNVFENPSGERGTANVVGASAAIGSTSQYQQFGAWSYFMTPGAPTTAGAGFGSWLSGSGTSYTASMYFRGVNGIPYRMGIIDAATLTTLKSGTLDITGGGTWHRYSVSYTENSTQNQRIYVAKRSSADTGTVYLDGFQVEAGSLTTYFDGDQEGCYWLGEPHRSQSVRSGTYRGGGSVVALEDLGLKPDEHMGIGMPPQEITSQSYALQAGAEYQRSRSGERPFTLTFDPILGTTTQGFHVTRKAIINAFKPDLLDPQQPVRFWYTGGQGTVQIDAVYASGLDLGEMNGPMAESGAVKFVAHDPFWRSTTQQGTSLAPRIVLGSANAIVRRDSLGRWGTLGAHGTSLAGTVDVLLMAPTGTLFVGGRIVSADGTVSRGLAMYFPSNNRFGSMGGTLTPGGVFSVRSLVYAPWGSLYIGGAFAAISGTAQRYVAQWNGAYGSLIGGTPNGNGIIDMALSGQGTMFMAGDFTQLAGTTSPFLGIWMPFAGAWGSLVGQAAGTVNDLVQAVAVGLDQKLYFTGLFGSAGGTAMKAIGQWKNGTFGTMSTGLGENAPSVPQGITLGVGANGNIYYGGGFGTVGGAPGTNVGFWNGVQLFPMGDGLGTNFNLPETVERIQVDPKTGDVYAAGRFGASGNRMTFPDSVARWNQYAWLPLDIDLPLGTDAIVRGLALAPMGDVYIGGQWTGTATAAAVGEIVNGGMGDAYPVFKARNMGAGTARLFQLVNTFTGDGLYFNYALLPGEEVTLTTEPGMRSFTSSFLGNVFSSILPGSNISGFRLTNGTNYISLFCDSGSVAASMFWTPRSDAVDGGTIF